MKITTDEDGTLVIGEVFSGAFIETSEGNRIGFCLRDDTIEFSVLPKDSEVGCRWFRVNMQTREVEEMVLKSEEEFRSKALELTNAILGDLEKKHSIKFDGKLTHTGIDMLAENVVEPFLRALDESKTDGGSE